MMPRFPKLTIKNILLLALVLRLVSAVFSRGYGWYDDHFGVLEVAQEWIYGQNHEELLPVIGHPRGDNRELSLFYPGIHYVLLQGFQHMGIDNPETEMLLIRLLHALYSMLIVYYGYKLAKDLADERCALYVALLLAAAWFMPNLSVRNLIEMVCVPPILIGCWMLMNAKDKWQLFWMAGFIAGFAFSIRYQSALFIGGMGLVLLMQKSWKGFFFFSTGVLVNALIFQGITDVIFWGYPFAKFLSYVHYNSVHSDAFTKGYWFNYILLVAGMLIPPLSILLWYGYFKGAKRTSILFVPSFIFLVFHCYFLNKQERFILPFIPLFIIAGTVGWYQYQITSVYWKEHKRLFTNIVVFAACINIVLLLPVTITSTKTSAIDAMTFLRNRHDCTTYIVEATDQSSWAQFPKFYLGQPTHEYILKSDYQASQLSPDLKSVSVKPNYVIFLSDEDLDNRVQKFKQVFPDTEFLVKIEPGFIDRLFHWLNPINRNVSCFVYKVKIGA